ncbi:MAG: MBL fold metallo-hydrolase [Chromatiales bacterium]|nr:MBL fold metallo-hydrolase [Chromatiales bacterium]
MFEEWALRFLGVGNSHAVELGSSAAVLERGGRPTLLIDCGPDTLDRYRSHYGGSLPQAVFITHTHLDHIGGLENLFYRAWFDAERRGQIQLFVPVRLVEVLQRRVADYPGLLAEDGVNFWDCFRLTPISEGFWLGGRWFSVFPVRHHQFHSCYGIALEGLFLYTGDTRPIPEVINRFAARGEWIFHDCALNANPSHTGAEELTTNYGEDQIRRMTLYHYESALAGSALRGRGYRVAAAGERIILCHSDPCSSQDKDDALSA